MAVRVWLPILALLYVHARAQDACAGSSCQHDAADDAGSLLSLKRSKEELKASEASAMGSSLVGMFQGYGGKSRPRALDALRKTSTAPVSNIDVSVAESYEKLAKSMNVTQVSYRSEG